MISVLAPPEDRGGDSAAITAAFTNLAGNIRYVLFDFDGPLCDLFAGPHRLALRRTLRMTRQLRALLTAHDRQAPVLRRRNDPHELFRSALDLLESWPEDRAVANDLRKLLERQEVEAAHTAVRTPGSEELVVWLSERGTGLVIVSNNCEAAIRVYLRGRRLLDFFQQSIIGRPEDHRLMKPDPHGIHLAMKEMQADPDTCLMIGDSLADVAAARSAGIRVCGYSPKRRTRQRLLAAGATFAVGSMHALHEALIKTADHNDSAVPQKGHRGF